MTAVGGISPAYMFKFYPISAVTSSSISFLADAAATSTVSAGGGSDCILFCWYADSRALPSNCISYGGSGSALTVTYSAAHGQQTGDIAYIQGLTGGAGLPADVVNGRFVITVTSSTTYTFTPAMAPTTASTGFGGSAGTVFYQHGTIGDASTGFQLEGSYGVHFVDNDVLDGFNGFHLICETSSVTPDWAPSTYYGVGATVANNGVLYVCSAAGVSATSGGPTGTGSGIHDGTGTLYWNYQTSASPIATWQPSTGYVVGNQVYNGANVYICTTVGTSAGSGGPTGTGSSIADNTVVWKYQWAVGAALPSWAPLASYSQWDRVQNQGLMYAMIASSGTSSSASPPTGTGANIADGSCYWSYTGPYGASAPEADIDDVTIQGGHIRCQNAVKLDSTFPGSQINDLTILPGNWEFWSYGILTEQAMYLGAVNNCVVRGGLLRAITSFQGRGIDGVPNHLEVAGIFAAGWVGGEISGTSIYSVAPISVSANLDSRIIASMVITNCTLNAAYDTVLGEAPVVLNDTQGTYALRNNYMTPGTKSGTATYGSWSGGAAQSQVQSFGNLIGYSAALPTSIAGQLHDVINSTSLTAGIEGWTCTAASSTAATWAPYGYNAPLTVPPGSSSSASINFGTTNTGFYGTASTVVTDIAGTAVLTVGATNTAISNELDVAGVLTVGGNTFLGEGSANYLEVLPATTGNDPSITMRGSDTNIGFNVFSKGTGSILLRSGNGVQLEIDDSGATSTGHVRVEGGTSSTNALIGTTSSQTLQINPSGANLILGTGSVLGGSATTGFVLIPAITVSSGSSPSGTPAGAGTGATAMVFDHANSKIWVYDQAASAWKGTVVS